MNWSERVDDGIAALQRIALAAEISAEAFVSYVDYLHTHDDSIVNDKEERLATPDEKEQRDTFGSGVWGDNRKEEP